jgi:hypothetical protein
MSHDEDRSEQQVRFPAMRSELQYAVCALADEDFQRRQWSGNPSIDYSFDTALHVLLDDSVVADQGEATVGTILKDESELRAVQDLIHAARRVIEDIGLHGTFDDARSLPSWLDALSAAQRARSVLGASPWFP